MDDITYGVWQSAVWDEWERAAHWDQGCESWLDDGELNVTCICGERVPSPQIVTVTARHIGEGQRWPSANPLALAVEDSIPGARWVVAGSRTLYVTLGDRRCEWTMPVDAQGFLYAWYEAREVAPMTFALPSAADFSYAWRPLYGTEVAA